MPCPRGHRPAVPGRCQLCRLYVSDPDYRRRCDGAPPGAANAGGRHGERAFPFVLLGDGPHRKGRPWPEKVDQMMRKYAPGVNYSQYTGNDPQVLKLALKTGRMPGITYGYSPRYGGRIAHMVNCAHFTDKWAAVLDNNFPHTFEWMSPDELLRRARFGTPGGYWIVFGWKAGRPPVPATWKANVAP